MRVLVLALITAASAASGSPSQAVVQIKGYLVGLGVAGGGAFRVSIREATDASASQQDPTPIPIQPISTLFVAPQYPDAAATVTHSNGTVTLSTSFGAVSITTATGVLTLADASGATIVEGPLIISDSQDDGRVEGDRAGDRAGDHIAPQQPRQHDQQHDRQVHHPRVCETTAQNNTDKGDGTRLAALEVKTQSDCCNGCAATQTCEAWIYATPPYKGPQNCWHMSDVTRTKASEGRVFGWAGPHPPSPSPGPPPPPGPSLILQLGGAAGTAAGAGAGADAGAGLHAGDVSTVYASAPPAPAHKSYGFGGASTEPGVHGDPFASVSATASVGNTKWYVPSYWGTEGYSVLAVAAAAAPSSGGAGAGSGVLNEYQAAWSRSSGASADAPHPGNGDSGGGGGGGGVRWTFAGDGSKSGTSSNKADLYLMPAATLAHGVSAMAALTGGAAVPPKYAFGFLACRWGWQNRSYIEATLNHFRSGGFPLDAFISDYGWFTNVPNAPTQDDFGYNPSTFPEPAPQLEAYHDTLHVRFGGIRKPRIENAAMLAAIKGKGWVLEGSDSNLNFSIPAVQEWYAQQQAHYLQDGVDFWWNDEGETAYEIYHLWNQAHALALAAHDPAKRSFTLNRAYTPGMGRDGVGIWTGDISVSWKAFQDTPLTVLRWGLAGAFFVACDTGGFEGGATPPELLARWYQLSAMLPIMRVHSRVQNPPHWPWLYGADAEKAMRGALSLRYRLLPTIYSLAHLAFTAGVPMVRPLLYDFPSDAAAATVGDQWTMGGNLLAAPVLFQSATQRSVVFPTTLAAPNAAGNGAVAGSNAGNGPTAARDGAAGKADVWFEFNTTATHAGGANVTFQVESLSTMFIFAKAGTVLPLAAAGVQYTAALEASGPLHVHIYSGADGAFTLVEDDGETFGYKHGAVRTTALRWDDSSSVLSWSAVGGYKGEHVFATVVATLFRAGAAAGVDSAVVALGDEGSLRF